MGNSQQFASIVRLNTTQHWGTYISRIIGSEKHTISCVCVTVFRPVVKARTIGVNSKYIIIINDSLGNGCGNGSLSVLSQNSLFFCFGMFLYLTVCKALCTIDLITLFSMVNDIIVNNTAA